MTNPSKYRHAPDTGAAEQLTEGTLCVDLASITWSGMNAAQAIECVLGPRPDRRTGDVTADCLAAMAELSAYGQQRKLWRKLILHVLYSLYAPQNEDVWLRVGRAIGHTKSTAYAWAHPAEK